MARSLRSQGPEQESAFYAAKAGLTQEVEHAQLRDLRKHPRRGLILCLHRRHPHGDFRQIRIRGLSDFRALFKQWASTSVAGLEELKAQSPVPLDLKPGQKL
jgi:hypothetical protein